MSFNRRKFHENWNSGKSQLKANCRITPHGVMYHKTIIVDTTLPKTRIFTGGWRTVTTKEHINEVMKAMGKEVYIFQKNFEWFVRLHNDPRCTFPFTEGFEV